MSKLTKVQSQRHQKAMDLVHSDRVLTWEDRWFILENYHESQGQLNTLAGAFFTPPGLARDFAIEVSGRSIVDLCAGIGGLSFACMQPGREITCVEQCEEYVVVGRRVVPDAEWIHADIFAAGLGRFDCAVSNPPFGAIKGGGFEGKYTGGQFEYKVIELASRIADYGVFILPQLSAPFRYSGERAYRYEEGDKARKFRQQTGINMGSSCGIDTSCYVGEWKGVSPICEVVVCDFSEPSADYPEINVAVSSVSEAVTPGVHEKAVKLVGEYMQASLFGGEPTPAPVDPATRRQRRDLKEAVERRARMAL